jgi:cell division protein DivIC
MFRFLIFANIPFIDMFLIRDWNNIKNRFAFVKNKYFLTLLLFLLWMLFFDQNNLLENKRYEREYRQLQKDKEYYLIKIQEDNRKLKELQTNTDNLEKFAREEYLMKRENEDIFVIIRED